jgi:NAD(P)-dependent dehydrogenase (short-subunit alcohol dehydrogenase family)
MNIFTFDHIPDQSGRTAIVTGANTGIGFETARMLAQKGAHVVLACRNLKKGEEAATRIKALQPKGTVTLEALDLSDLDSVDVFSKAFGTKHPRLDLLINNAGVMVPPFGQTKQGFELQIGTNHLGHFALTHKLLPLLMKQKGARVVVVASSAQSFGRINFDDLNWKKRRYVAFRAYGQSKLANMMFALELQRRLDAAGADLMVTAAHPGYTATDLQRTMALGSIGNRLFAMSAPEGAMPTLRAATDPSAGPASYYGPRNFFGMNGPPVLAPVPKHAQDRDVARRLWELSEQLTGVTYASVAR